MANATTETKSEQKPDALAIPVAPTVAKIDDGQPKSAQVQAWDLIVRKATAYAKSSLVPEAFRGDKNVPSVIIALEMAERLGASPLMVMQNLYVVSGNPGWSSKFLIATVNASKKFTPLRFDFEGKPHTDEWGCRAVAKDIKTREKCVGTLVTIKMAKDEGWATKSGSKWKTIPELMLQYRAAAFWTRVFSPELSLGLRTAEEVIDVHGEQVPGLPPGIVQGSADALEAELVNAEPPHDADGVIEEPTS